jgi:E3 ubiquitin-protein ligase UBR1
MSGLSSFLQSRLLGSINPHSREREPRATDPLTTLRYALETLPNARANKFTPAVRAQLLAELYNSLWGPHVHLFVPGTQPSTGAAAGGQPGQAQAQQPVQLPPGALLAETQARARFHGAGAPDPPLPGRPCGHIFAKGESCFRCK